MSGVYRFTEDQIAAALQALGPEHLPAAIDAIYADLEGSEAAEDYHRRHMTSSMGILTVARPEEARLLVKPIRHRILNKSVVEIGAGVGLFALEMARYANQVIGIESDPAWSWAFVNHLHHAKPEKLTWIFGRAETVSRFIEADVAVILTHSGHTDMLAVARRMAPEVIDYYAEYPGKSERAK